MIGRYQCTCDTGYKSTENRLECVGTYLTFYRLFPFKDVVPLMVFRYVTVCFSASQTSTSVPLRMVAVRLSAPTQREAMSAAATVDTPWCLTWEAVLVSSSVSCLAVCHSVTSWSFKKLPVSDRFYSSEHFLKIAHVVALEVSIYSKVVFREMWFKSRNKAESQETCL